jgi:pseudaminic acid biosynthesis-associated methylase
MDECESFWAGEFGDNYTDRNSGRELVEIRKDFFRLVLDEDFNYDSDAVIEFGANRGVNLQALHELGAHQDLMTAVEVNASACAELKKALPGVDVHNSSMFDIKPPRIKRQLVLTMGLLIHLPPHRIDWAYDIIFEHCAPGGLVMMTEYFAPTETEVSYRGNSGKLWRRDYGGDFRNRFLDKLELVDYGFVSKYDPIIPMDDVNYWIFEKV